jgi:hypothetical protein
MDLIMQAFLEQELRSGPREGKRAETRQLKGSARERSYSLEFERE